MFLFPLILSFHVIDIALSSIPCLAHPPAPTQRVDCAKMCQYTPRISWRCRISSKDIHPWPFMVERCGKCLCGARRGQNQGQQNLSLTGIEVWWSSRWVLLKPDLLWFYSWPGNTVNILYTTKDVVVSIPVIPVIVYLNQQKVNLPRCTEMVQIDGVRSNSCVEAAGFSTGFRKLIVICGNIWRRIICKMLGRSPLGDHVMYHTYVYASSHLNV